jgi:hypothetical protein
MLLRMVRRRDFSERLQCGGKERKYTIIMMVGEEDAMGDVFLYS